ncbi:MAG: hypothetical protein LKJ44_04485 [Bifidobacteriaceae bacterium]|nr:hypothetical protein [Bifidobacteriaceae bacterium]MCI1978956.1 hypothetical protein [Bifidobacteriaceae bacterium]
MDEQQLAVALYDIASPYLDSETKWVLNQAIKAGEPEGPILSIVTAAPQQDYEIPLDLILKALAVVDPENRDLIEQAYPDLAR